MIILHDDEVFGRSRQTTRARKEEREKGIRSYYPRHDTPMSRTDEEQSTPAARLSSFFSSATNWSSGNNVTL